MEYKQKIRIAVAVVSVAAISFLLAKKYRSRRSRRQKCTARSSCYLHSDQKPQSSFKRVLADNSFSQFKHLRLHDNSSNLHPYEKEIIALIESAGIEFGFDGSDSLEFKELSDDYIWVGTEDQLKELANKLSKEKAFAVDTEQHSLRSFLGFTALIQISTQNEDYLLDAIALHDVMAILGPVFADSGICKVFHGADNDVLWLQRDFHIYVVNLFDTAKACEVLSKPQKSLAYLLETYCSVSTNKLLQREDWRQRPLSAEMLQYAQTDAHYLLYIASCLITELKQQNDDNSSSCPDDKLNFVLEASRRSNMICLQLYTKEVEEFPGDSAASSLLSRHLNGHGGSSVSCEIQDLVRWLCTWRELMARVHDESLRYVLPDQSIVSLAEKGLKSSTEIYDAIAQADVNMDPPNFVPVPTPSPVVCNHFNDFCSLIQESGNNLEDIFPLLLQKCLGPDGSCPLSIYNYGLLVSCELRLTNKSVMKKNEDRNSKQSSRKASRSRELFVQKFSCKSPVYHNCRIYANDGRLLCYCDQRKLEWYLRRDLAKLLDENPPAIMLLFEPKGRPEDEDNDFYIQSKKNICVGCGEGRHYLRYRIIPSCYRVHFPEHLKSHRSHDIVLLCVDCHEVAHVAAEKYKRHVAEEFGIPLFVRRVADSKEIPVICGPSSELMNAEQEGVSPLQLRTAAMALLRHGPKMPPNRREELTQIVTQYYGGREISQEDLERALLVGMSPHERRRFEKKRGLSLKQSATDTLARNEPVHEVSVAKSSTENKIDSLDGPKAAVTEPPTDDKEHKKTFNMTNCDIGVYSNNVHLVDTSVTAYIDINSNRIEISTGNDVEACEVCSNVFTGLDHPPHDGHGLPKNNSKLSLLGHGPHGKQVVEHLLKEYGENGIREFCQRWRQVFVEAVHPRFLPAGWDVMHSGRRDFGEFSVYNPAKRSVSGADKTS